MTDSPSCRYVGHYFVLVLVRDNHNLTMAQDKIENSCRHFMPVTAIAFHTDRFNDWLIEGHQFVNAVCRMAVLLHGADEKKNDFYECPLLN